MRGCFEPFIHDRLPEKCGGQICQLTQTISLCTVMACLTRVAFPPEIWSHILNNIPKSHQTQLLHVSSLFHDIVMKSLFASIKIYFIGGSEGLTMLSTIYLDWMEDVADRLMCKSWELLNHIVQERRFANVVKSITVIAFSDGLSVFERCELYLLLKILFSPIALFG